jgi:hypothetical protein
MPIKLTGNGQPVVPDQPQQRYTDSNRPIGSKAVFRGRSVVWGGPEWRWQSAAAFDRLKRTGRLNRSILSDPLGVIGNELRYIGRQMAATNARAGDRPQLRGSLLDRFGQALARQGRDAVRTMASPLPAVTALANPLGQTGRNLSAAVAVGAAENAAKLAVAAGQGVRGRRANPESSRASALIETITEAGYRAMGATPPGQQNQFERGLDATARSSTTAAVGTAAAIPMIPAIGSGAGGAVITGGARWAVGELLSTLADDNRGGNLMNIGEAVTGQRLPLAVDVGQDDWLSSAFKSLLPNAAPGVALSGLGEALGGFRNTRRWLSGQRTIAERTEARQRLEKAGIVETDPATGASTLREAEADAQEQINSWINAGRDPSEAPPPPAEAGARSEAGGAAAPPSPPAEAGAMEVDGLDIAPGDFVYDPALPEADVVLGLVRDLGDADLQRLVAGSEPVIPQLSELLQAREAAPVRTDLEQGRVMAPSTAVAERIGPDRQPLTYQQTLEGMNPDFLRSVAAPENNADLARLISDFTGRDWEEFTRADIIEGLVRYQEEEGLSLLSRDWDQNMRPTAEIQADPQRFQFKGNTNEAGEQIGNSLAGVDRWDVVAEGVIDVWTDPANGVTYVVNGHNRLARGRQLGIPTLPTRELQAAAAGEARALGALANIKEGRGTVFDAAKFIRESGITTPDQLQRMGAPMKDGHAARGLALAQLPDDLFQAAIEGRLSVGKAAALGGSGLDEQGMRAAFKSLGGRDMSDAKFAEIVEQVRNTPRVVVDDGQGRLPWLDEEPLLLMEQKADLVVKIRSDLLKDKRFFGTAARGADRLEQAGNRINVEGNKAIAADAEQVLSMFDRLKYAPGPVSDLLNDGARQIAEGAKAKVVADRIRDQVAEAVRVSLEDQGLPMQRPAGAAAADPAALPALTPEQRDALQLDVVRKAVNGAEVRPPESPLPALPDGPAVRLDVAGAELGGNRGRPQPGTKAAQAMADELRLAAEFHERDAEMRAITEEGLRDAVGYELKTFEEKKALGMADGYDVSSVSQGWDSFDTGGKSDLEIAQDMIKVEHLIRKVAGDDVAVRFHDEYIETVTAKAWGGDGIKTSTQAGVYRFLEDLVQVNGFSAASSTDLIETGFHESFHRIQFMALGSQDMKALDGVFARLKADLGARVDGIAYLESQAIAFQRYARARFLGQDPIAALVGADLRQLGRLPTRLEKAATSIIRAFDKVADFIERVVNVIQGNGPTSIKRIFKRAYEGSLRNGLPEDVAYDPDRLGQLVAWQKETATGAPVGNSGATGLKGQADSALGDGMVNSNLLPAPVRPEPMRLADGEEPAAKPRTEKADIEARRQIEANNQRMDDIRRQAQQEGC